MKAYHKTGSIIQRTAWLPLRVLFSWFLKLEIKGLENVKQLKSPAIFASNHTNELDPLIVVASLKWTSRHLPLVFVSGEPGFYSEFGWKRAIYGGIFFKLMAALPAYSGLKDYHQALPHHLNAIKGGRSVCIFPMGTRHHDEEIKSAKAGVAFLAAESELPIIPVRIKGLGPTKSQDFWHKKRKVQIIFGNPLNFSEIDQVNTVGSDKVRYEQAAQRLMEKVIKL